MKKINEQDIFGIIEKALKLKKGKLTMNSSMSNTENWDSLGHLTILVALDKFFSGRAAGISSLAKADSVKKIIKILKEKSLL